MKFASRAFLIAAIYGLVAMPPMYFLEAKMGHDYPPAINHPEYYYGFAGVGLAWQMAFYVISRDPLRYRPLMIPAMVEKASFSGAVFVLFALQRVHPMMVGLGIIDLCLGIGFLMSYLKTARA